jgi:hypothetical protein
MYLYLCYHIPFIFLFIGTLPISASLALSGVGSLDESIQRRARSINAPTPGYLQQASTNQEKKEYSQFISINPLRRRKKKR